MQDAATSHHRPNKSKFLQVPAHSNVRISFLMQTIHNLSAKNSIKKSDCMSEWTYAIIKRKIECNETIKHQSLAYKLQRNITSFASL